MELGRTGSGRGGGLGDESAGRGSTCVFLHVLEGSVELTLARRSPVTLHTGDSICHDGNDGQALRNPTGHKARLFAVIWPPL